jgi:hypothetical protein
MMMMMIGLKKVNDNYNYEYRTRDLPVHKHHATKMYRGVEAVPCILNETLDEGECGELHVRSARYTLEKKPDGPQNQSGRSGGEDKNR